MTAWRVELRGERIDLDYLSRELSSGETTVTEENGRYYLTSRGFDSLTEARDVLDKATELLGAVNGLALVRLRDFRPVGVAGIAQILEDGKPPRQFIFPEGFEGRVGMHGKVHVRKLADTTDDTDASGESAVLDNWLTIAMQTPKAQEAITIFGSVGGKSADDAWGALYEVFELIREDLGGGQTGERQIARNGWATRSKIDQFRQTAQPYRHAPGIIQPSKKPMTVSEGKSFIGNVLRQWLNLGD